MRGSCISKALRFRQITAEHQDCLVLNVFSSQNSISYRFCLNFANIEAAIGGKSSRERFWKKSSQCREIRLQVKKVIRSFGCYGNSDAIVTLINANVHHHLIQLWRLFFQIFENGDVFYAQTWEVLTLKNSIEPPYVGSSEAS